MTTETPLLKDIFKNSVIVIRGWMLNYWSRQYGRAGAYYILILTRKFEIGDVKDRFSVGIGFQVIVEEVHIGQIRIITHWIHIFVSFHLI